MSDQEVVEMAVAERQLPGAVLRQARQAQGLTLGEVAGALKFSTRQIEALEADDFEQLQGKTFQRGFIRAYARMLKLAPEPLLQMLETDTLPIGEQIVPPANMGETNPTPFYRRHGKKLLMAMAIAVGFAGLAWVYDDAVQNRRTSTVTVPPATPVLTPVPVVTEPSPPATASPLSGTASLSADAPVAVSAVPASPASTASSVPPVASALPVVPALPVVSAVPAPRALSFEFSERSWLEVKDATGRILLTGEFPAGQKQAISGKPPYQLWIGRASAVRVTYGDRVVDLKPYIRDEVARLTLDQ